MSDQLSPLERTLIFITNLVVVSSVGIKRDDCNYSIFTHNITIQYKINPLLLGVHTTYDIIRTPLVLIIYVLKIKCFHFSTLEVSKIAV